VPDFDVEQAARMSPGLSGAELANAMNEAALLAARRKQDVGLGRCAMQASSCCIWGEAIEDSSWISLETRMVIDEETRRIVTEQYERAQELLRKHEGTLQRLSQVLLAHESVDGSAVQEALHPAPQPASS